MPLISRAALRPIKTLIRRPDISTLENAIMISFPLIGLGAMGLLIWLEMYNFALLGVYLAIPMIFAPLIYAYYKRFRANPADPVEAYRKTLDAPWLFKAYIAVFLTGLTFTIVLLAVSEVRPLLYYAVVAVMATVVLLQVLTQPLSRDRTLVILAEITMLALSLIWGVSLKYEYFIGRTDSLAHAFYIDVLLQNGVVTSALADYQTFPLWHILCSETYLLTGTDLSTMQVTFIVCGLIFAAMPAFAYLAGMKLAGDPKVALVAALMMSFYPYFQVLGTQGLARSVTSFLFVVLIYLLLCRDRRLRLLSLPVTAAILAFHPVAILFMMVILVTMYVLNLLIRPSGPQFISLKYLAVIALMTVSYWMLSGGGPLQEMLSNVAAPAASGVVTESVYNVPVAELFNYVQYGLIITILILGALFALGSLGYDKNSRIFALVAVILIPLSYPGPLYLVNKLAHNMNVERFYENGILFVALGAAICVCCLLFRSKLAGKAALLVVFAALVFFSVSNDFVASDNPLVKRESYTFYFTEEEVSAFNSVPQAAAGRVLTDYVAARYLSFSPYTNSSGLIEVDAGNDTLLKGMEGDLLLIRDGELEKRPLKLYTVDNDMFIFNPDWDSLAYYSRDGPLNVSAFDGYDRVYDSGGVSAYAS